MNRTRASSLDAFGTRDQRNRIYPALEASDGSTLSLDFTQMSSLDPSLFTFTRASTCTYINSQGYVAFADHNLAINSTWTDANATPTGWTVYNGSTPNAVISIPETGKRSITVSSGVQSFMYQAQTINPGIANTLSIVVHSVTGTGPTISNLLAINAAVAPPGSGNILYYKDGVSVSSTTEVTPGSWSMVFSGGNQIRLLQGSNAATSTYTIVISSPQLQQGFVPLPAIVNNTSTSSAYQAPRFDYDPTTLAPRGLLIEGSATNLLNWSESFATSGGTNNNWADTNITRNSTNNTDPANGTTALRITASAGNGTIISSAAMGTSAERTFSIWLRRVGGTGNIQYTLDNGTAYTTQAITSSWVRYTFPATTAAQRVGIRIVTSGDSIELWGAQLEAGSGASSYIPTGSSTVQRAADRCEITSGIPTLYDSVNGVGTFFVDVLPSTLQNAQGGIELGAGTGNQGSTNRVSYRRDATIVGSTTLNLTPTGGGQRFKTATAFAPSDLSAVRNGGTAVTSTTNVTLTGLTALKFYVDAFAGGLQFYGTVRQIKLWPTRLPDSILRSLTL